MGHNHHHQKEISSKNLLISVVLNFTITIAQVIGGIISNSLALLSDALHNLSDGIAVLIAYIAYRIGKKKSNYRNTFGFRRAEILAALLNSVVLIAISFYLFIEAFEHYMNPEPVNGLIMFIVAVVGLLANLAAVLLLKKDSKKSLNIKAAYVHLLGDTLSSVAVVIGGILIIYYKIYWVDPLITVLIGLYILKETWGILKDVIKILMQSVPPNIDLSKLKNRLTELDEIDNVHHVHVWSMADDDVHFEGHIDLNFDPVLSETEIIRKKLEEILTKEYYINHVIIQFECGSCDNTDFVYESH